MKNIEDIFQVKKNKDSQVSLTTNLSGAGYNALERFFSEVGLLTFFFIRFFKEVFLPPYEFKEFIKQSYLVGYKSLQLVAVTGFITGLVLTIQAKPTLAEFGAESWIPAMVAASIVREVGPIITALICAGKVGSGIGAELASMRITEQIDAMEVSGNNPFKYIVVTRILATTFMVPLLIIMAEALALFGAYLGINISGDVSLHLFFSDVFTKLSFTDIFTSFIKTFFFGFTIGLVACYKGYHSNTGTAGVGFASNQAVVLASFLIFILDMIAAQIYILLVE